MASERRRFLGELAAWHAAEIIRRLPLTAEALDPDRINPYRVEPPVTEAMRRLEEWRAKRRWKVMFGKKTQE
jgi:hypothetical protein